VGRRHPLLRKINAKVAKTRGGEGKDLTIRTLYLPALIVAGVLMACAVVVLALSEKAEATFPGKNGRKAYEFYGGREGIYTSNPGGGGKTRVTFGFAPSYSPDGKRIAFTEWDLDGHDLEIYTIRAGGGSESQVTDTKHLAFDPS
jgi:WD40-like Beta Propeller Repeat